MSEPEPEVGWYHRMANAQRAALRFAVEHVQQFLLKQLRENSRANTRTLPERLIQFEHKDGRDHRMMADIVSRVGKALRRIQRSGFVVGSELKNGRISMARGQRWSRNLEHYLAPPPTGAR